MNTVFRTAIAAAVIVAGLLAPAPTEAYSVLAHEANVDAVWDSQIAPMLLARFPGTSPAQILEARSYAYGGCVIQDLGYYPFGSHFFSNLLHYVRTGDFIEALIRDAGDPNEYAFALGALGHYAADNEGHELAVNLAVPMMYPKLKKQFGNRVTYEQSPKSHVLVEFSFDVVQVAAAAYAPEAYHSFIGFKVAKPLLERAFSETYGIQMKDIFFSVDLAIGTYRHAVATTIPGMTKVAWSKKRKDISKVVPNARKKTFVFSLRRKQYEKEFGIDYEKPHGFARVLGFLYRIIPKIGPFRALSFSVPTPAAERLFLDSFTVTRQRFRQSLDSLAAGNLRLANTDFDTGKPTKRGEYALADATHDELLEKLAEQTFVGASDALRSNLAAYYGNPDSLPTGTEADRRHSALIRERLLLLHSVPQPVGASQPPPQEHPAENPPETAAEAHDDKPPTPAHTGVRALVKGLVADIGHLPSVHNLYGVSAGGGLAIAARPADRSLNARFVRQSDFANDVFAPGKYFGDTPEQMGLSIGTWAIGRALHKPRLSHLGVDLLRAQALTVILVEPIKLAVRRQRPDASDRRSFPSGHAAITFAAAAIIERHLGWRNSLVAYSIAAYVATSRLHDNRHYLSDVVFGAALGSVAGRTVTRHGRQSWAFSPTVVPGGVALLASRTGR